MDTFKSLLKTKHVNIYSTKVLLIFSIFFLTGCFEIVEEVTMNDDGSGHIEISLNLSSSKIRLNSIMLMDSINNYKVPSKAEIEKNINNLTSEIKKIEGVSAVKQSIDFDEFIFSVSCDFTDVEALNRVVQHFNTNGAMSKHTKQYAYESDKKIFKRNYEFDLSKDIKKVNSDDRKILDGASLTTIYRFESPIVSSSNEQARISGSKKAIMLKIDAQDMISNRSTIKNTIQLQ